jgi:hypothetical protein
MAHPLVGHAQSKTAKIPCHAQGQAYFLPGRAPLISNGGMTVAHYKVLPNDGVERILAELMQRPPFDAFNRPTRCRHFVLRITGTGAEAQFPGTPGRARGRAQSALF